LPEHAEISLSSLEHFKDEFESCKTYVWKMIDLESDEKMKNKGMELIKSIDSSIEIINECLEKPLHDGYLDG